MKIKPRYFEDENRCGDIIPEEIEKFVNDPNIKLGIFTLMKELDSSEGHLPRQNVVDEAARFSTKLGRERVLLIVEEGIQPPTNLSGIVYLSYKGDDEGGIQWNDPEIGIEWPLGDLTEEDIILSEKDQLWKPMSETPTDF